MQTTFIGRMAEQVAAEYLEEQGFRILDQNWRRRECEIDIIAMKEGVVYLVEVKYRGSDGAGKGLDYITAAKIRQMSYAARRWVAESNWNGEYTLAAIELEGEKFQVMAFIDDVTV
jgi:putative endonuclease